MRTTWSLLLSAILSPGKVLVTTNHWYLGPSSPLQTVLYRVQLILLLLRCSPSDRYLFLPWRLRSFRTRQLFLLSYAVPPCLAWLSVSPTYAPVEPLF